jgi:hypothetical protein
VETGTGGIRHALTFDEHNVMDGAKRKIFGFRAIEFLYQLIPRLQRRGKKALSSLLSAGL